MKKQLKEDNGELGRLRMPEEMKVVRKGEQRRLQ